MGAVFALIGAIYYWMEKITGTKYNETLGKIHFYTMFIGVLAQILFNTGTSIKDYYSNTKEKLINNIKEKLKRW